MPCSDAGCSMPCVSLCYMPSQCSARQHHANLRADCWLMCMRVCRLLCAAPHIATCAKVLGFRLSHTEIIRMEACMLVASLTDDSLCHCGAFVCKCACRVVLHCCLTPAASDAACNGCTVTAPAPADSFQHCTAVCKHCTSFPRAASAASLRVGMHRVLLGVML